MRAAQSIGLTLGEIREIVALRDRGETPCRHVTDLVQRREAEIEARITALQHLRSELRQLKQRATSLNPADCHPDLICHLIAPATGEQ